MIKKIVNNNKLINLITVLISLLVFMFFIIYVLPLEMKSSIEMGLLNMPDTKLFYTRNELYQIAESYSLVGRSYYIQRRFTFDIMWPLSYMSFIFTSCGYLLRKLKLEETLLFKSLNLILLGVLFDFLENIFVSIVMALYPVKALGIDVMAGVFTLFKWIFIIFSFVGFIVLIALFIFKKIRVK